MAVRIKQYITEQRVDDCARCKEEFDVTLIRDGVCCYCRTKELNEKVENDLKQQYTEAEVIRVDCEDGLISKLVLRLKDGSTCGIVSSGCEQCGADSAYLDIELL